MKKEEEKEWSGVVYSLTPSYSLYFLYFSVCVHLPKITKPQQGWKIQSFIVFVDQLILTTSKYVICFIYGYLPSPIVV